jgi:hypothetical protein
MNLNFDYITGKRNGQENLRVNQLYKSEQMVGMEEAGIRMDAERKEG